MSDNKVTGVITAVNEPDSISGGKYNKMTFVVSNKEGYNGADKDYAFEIFEKAEGERIANFKKVDVSDCWGVHISPPLHPCYFIS